MTEFKEGDLVKVTLAGKVWAVGSDEIEVDGFFFGLQDEAVTIEKLPDPLPTTPGSVIRHRTYGDLRFRTADHKWLFDGDVAKWGDDFMDDPSEYDVVFDAGAEK